MVTARDFDAARGEPVCEPVRDSVTGADFRSTAGRTADNRSIGELLKDLRDESSTLIRQEMALAKTEMSEKAAKYGRNAGYLGAGAALATAALIVLLFGLSALLYHGLVELGLENYVAGWLALLIVGAVSAAIGYALIQKAINAFKHEPVVPEKTVASVKENTQWLQRKATTA